MNVGIAILVVIAVVTLAQVLLQGSERRKQHQEITDRLDRLEAERRGKG
jgi:hypothetical protein